MTAAQLLFAGRPDRLEAVLRDVSIEAEATATLTGVEARHFRLRPLSRGDSSGVRATLKLPATTAPGTYRGVVRIGERELAAAVEVEPHRRARSHPPRLSVEAGPSSSRSVELAVANEGNVAFTVPAKSSLCLFEGDGIHHAIWAALTSDPPKGKQRIDVLLDDLADSHGGLVDVRAKRQVSIEPGEAQTVVLTLTFSDRLRAGHAYTGTWEPGGLRVPLHVSVPARVRRRSATPEAA
jgi:hypothetical protein